MVSNSTPGSPGLLTKGFLLYSHGMKKILIALFTVAALALSGPGEARNTPQPVLDGDIIFQPSLSRQSLAIRLATGSPYTHCGIIFYQEDGPYVLEAVNPVSWKPLADWIARGIGGQYVVLRLKDRERLLTPDALAAVRRAATAFEGKGYDLLFQWSDEAIYCSELVWKAYERGAGVALVPLRRLRDYDLDHEEVQRIIKERLGYDIPWEEQVIAPSDIMKSELLERVDGSD